jgi:hypothetical protein
MKDNDFKIIFDSERHEVDVETLIGCLMHTSNIIQEVNRSLHTEKKIEVKIKALEKGSFEVHIELIEKLIESLFSSQNITYGASIVTIVSGLYYFAQFLKGKKPQKIEIINNNNVQVTNINGDITTIQNNVYNIFNENKTVRDNIAKQFSILKESTDVSGFSFNSNKDNTYISQEEFPLIAIKLDDLDDVIKEPIKEILTDKNILIIRPSFTKDLKWDFVFQGQKISAKMEDEEMIKIIDNGEQFSKGDYMLVDLEVTKFYDSDLDTYLINKDSYKILKFKQHIQSPKQKKLF